MLNNFGINLTRSIDDPDRATVAMVIANAAVASGKNTMVFLSSEGVRLAVKGVAAGGAFWVCSPCFKKRGYGEGDLIEGAILAGGARLVEFMTNDATGVSY